MLRPDPRPAGGVPVAPVAIVHDYLTQRGGAERVVLALAAAFPGAPIHTALFDPSGTFPELAALDVRPSPLDRVVPLRAHHRMALPFLAPTFSRLRVDAEVAVCSSSGWAHGAAVSGAKVVYCHTPARWLYQTGRYVDAAAGGARLAMAVLGPPLRRWDRRAAHTADRYLVNSEVVRQRVAEHYGIEAEVVPPPVDLDTSGPAEPVASLTPGFFLCVSRLLAYKNVGAVAEAFRRLPDHRLVIVGEGPLAEEITGRAPPNVTLLRRTSDAQLRWLYASATGVVAASYEDFGLTPVEAAAFGTPSAVLRWGGFLDTTVEGTTGVFFDRPEPGPIADAVAEVAGRTWDRGVLTTHAARYATPRFTARLRAVVDEVRSGRSPAVDHGGRGLPQDAQVPPERP